MAAHKNFTKSFSEARTSYGFVLGLLLLIVGWVGLNYLPGPTYHFDITDVGDHFGILNFMLSIEASLSMPLLFMTQAWEAAADREKLDELVRATKALVHAMTEIKEEITEE